MRQRLRTPSMEVLTTNTSFVDLAGSEDIGRSGATGITAKEAGRINKSLLALVADRCARGQRETRIPYRTGTPSFSKFLLSISKKRITK